MMNLSPIYQLTNIQHFFGDKKVLDIPELTIQKGSITGLSGPNGSGKSTLLQLMAFARKPTRGSIYYNQAPALPFSPAVRSKVTLLTQKPYLLKRSVFENIAYGLKIRKDIRKLDKRIGQALSLVGLDYSSFAQRSWHALSGGETQRVALAARLILKPEVLLLDEPIASVDIKSASLIRQAALNAREQWGTTLIIASHDFQWLYSIGDIQLSMLNGRLFSTGDENIISGPFEVHGDHTLIKKLKDGQMIQLPSPPGSSNAHAAIIKNGVVIQNTNPGRNQHINQLSGTTTSMIAEAKTGRVMITITVCDLRFILKLSADEITNLQLFPGKEVTIQFHKNDIEWV